MCFFFQFSGHPRDLHSFPTRRSSDLRLGIPFQRIRLLQGDSDQLIAGGGTGGSKSMMTSGAAIVEAGEKVVEAGRQDRKSTRLNSSHQIISYAVFCLKRKKGAEACTT